MARACTIRELIADLSRCNPEAFVLCEMWFPDDVTYVDETACPAETRATLTHVAHHFDAELGINWDTLACALSCVRDSEQKGLDIYFYASEKRGTDKSRIPASRYAEADSDGDIEVGYFRKVNALFKWVHDHIGAFENCEKVLVTEAHLRALQQDLQALTPENCQTRFPTTEGFFFGSTAYDEAYWADVEGVRRWLSEITETFDFDAESLFFVAWW
ncbi:hypothetical protein [Escherichia coli]|uniref:hypothetical protein n=1 Tax=Escherichia coli TaxID=562 RepID=UPI0021BFB0A1|nr:hypothetical protein [Escherichia coli]